MFSKVGQGSTFWVELREPSSTLITLSSSLIVATLALGVGASALPVLPRETRPPLDHLDSDQTFTSPPPSMSEMELQLMGQSETVLEQTTSSDGLVQLIPRKRKAGDGPENGSCKGSVVFAPRTTHTPPFGEDNEGELSRPGTSSGPPLAPVPTHSHTQTPVSASEIQTVIPNEREPQPELRSATEMQGVRTSIRVPRPAHVELPPPPQLQPLPSPQKTPSPPANRSSQIDVPPGLQVLVVDDDKLTRMLFQRMLGRLKCQVMTAVNGHEALRLITGDQNVPQTPAEEHEHLFLDDEDHTGILEVDREEQENKLDRKSVV